MSKLDPKLRERGRIVIVVSKVCCRQVFWLGKVGSDLRCEIVFMMTVRTLSPPLTSIVTCSQSIYVYIVSLNPGQYITAY